MAEPTLIDRALWNAIGSKTSENEAARLAGMKTLVEQGARLDVVLTDHFEQTKPDSSWTLFELPIPVPSNLLDRVLLHAPAQTLAGRLAFLFEAGFPPTAVPLACETLLSEMARRYSPEMVMPKSPSRKRFDWLCILAHTGCDQGDIGTVGILVGGAMLSEEDGFAEAAAVAANAGVRARGVPGLASPLSLMLLLCDPKYNVFEPWRRGGRSFGRTVAATGRALLEHGAGLDEPAFCPCIPNENDKNPNVLPRSNATDLALTLADLARAIDVPTADVAHALKALVDLHALGHAIEPTLKSPHRPRM